MVSQGAARPKWPGYSCVDFSSFEPTWAINSWEVSAILPKWVSSTCHDKPLEESGIIDLYMYTNEEFNWGKNTSLPLSFIKVLFRGPDTKELGNLSTLWPGFAKEVLGKTKRCKCSLPKPVQKARPNLGIGILWSAIFWIKGCVPARVTCQARK